MKSFLLLIITLAVLIAIVGIAIISFYFSNTSEYSRKEKFAIPLITSPNNP